MITTTLNKVRTWFSTKSAPDKCLQCGLPPGGQFMISTDEPIMHPHQCSWCSTTLYVPGPMFQCKTCSEDGVKQHSA